jgi:hypothetical protein
MNIYVHHDGKGTIVSLVAVDAPAGCGIMLTPKAGTFVAEVEGLTFKSGRPTPSELREIADAHKVSGPAPRCRLEKR